MTRVDGGDGKPAVRPASAGADSGAAVGVMPAGSGTTSTRRRILPLALLLGALVLLVFLRSVNNGFVDYDDPGYVSENPTVLGGLSVGSVRWAFTTGEMANWHPVTWLSHLLDASLFGAAPWGHHLTSVLLHAANAVLLALLLAALTGRMWVALATAALFAFHPLRVESVTWISERKDVLSGMFFMLTLQAWTRYVRGEIRRTQGHDPTGIPGHDLNSGTSELRIVSQGIPDRSSESNVSLGIPSNARVMDSSKSQGHDPEFHENGNRVMSRIFTPNGQAGDSSKSQGHDPEFHENGNRVMSRIFTPNGQAGDSSKSRIYLLSLVLFALGLMAKPMLVTLPFVLLLLDWWPLGRLAGAGTEPWRLDRRRVAFALLEKVPFVALAAASGVVTYLVQKGGGAVNLMEGHHAAARFETAVTAYFGYLGKMLWPAGLSVFYTIRRTPQTGWWAWAGLVLLAGATAWVVISARRRPAILTGWGWYLVMLAPVIGIVQVGLRSMADRYTYLPGIGLALALCWWLESLTRRHPAIRRSIPAVAVAVFLALSAATWVQIGVWRDSFTLFEHAAAVDNDNWLAHDNLASIHAEAGRAEPALRHLDETIRILPGSAPARTRRATILLTLGRRDEAVRELKTALHLDPLNVEANSNLGALLAGEGRVDEAIEHFRAAIAARPGYAGAHLNLGIALESRGELAGAVEEYRRALDALPGFQAANRRLCLALARMGGGPEALARLESALAADPGDREVAEALAGVLRKLGRTGDARIVEERARQSGSGELPGATP